MLLPATRFHYSGGVLCSLLFPLMLVKKHALEIKGHKMVYVKQNGKSTMLSNQIYAKDHVETWKKKCAQITFFGLRFFAKFCHGEFL